MPRSSRSQEPVATLDHPVRVRYVECDPMGVAHHSSYIPWMEMARTEMLRTAAGSYRDMEVAGVFFVVAKMSVRYRKPARYDDALIVRCHAMPSAGVKVEHRYEIYRGDEKLTEAETTLVCVDGAGKVQPIPSGVMDVP